MPHGGKEERLTNAIRVPGIEASILHIRGQNVMLDADLAKLYGVETFNLNKAVKRNRERFPEDFMFQLTESEFADLRFQNGMSSSHGGRRHPPFVFTEHGVAMLSSVLRSPRAVQVNISIMRAFVRMRGLLLSNADLARKVAAIEATLMKHDEQFRAFHEIILPLLAAIPAGRKKIGFTPKG
ncbi:MAG: ORF6N domain-containing protein [Candidatus Riflebacteria bacterium]|nr:ORF6N domain-containing protein [Candidatus Riflebacteria bacterium]